MRKNNKEGLRPSLSRAFSAGAAYAPMDSIKDKPQKRFNRTGGSRPAGNNSFSDRRSERPSRPRQERPGGFANRAPHQPSRGGNTRTPRAEGGRSFGNPDRILFGEEKRTSYTSQTRRGPSDRGTGSRSNERFPRGERPSRSGDRYGNSRGGGNRGRGRGRGNQSSAQKIHPSRYISKSNEQAPEEKAQVDQAPKTHYKDFNFDEALNANLKAKGYTHATPIQAQTIPLVQSGKNVLGISATGSGKTAAFLTPLINKLLKDSHQRVLVLAPTRELAMQIQKEAISMIRGTFIRAALIIGGESMFKQNLQLKGNPQIVIGTPGRILDQHERGNLRLDVVRNVVLDEVDRMLDMGFIPDVRKIFSFIPEPRQTLFFSATIENSVKKVVGELAQTYETVSIAENKPIHSVWQDIVEFTDLNDKLDKLEDILVDEEVSKSIIFVETKHFADKIEKILRERGHSVAALHGGKTQSRRTNVIRMYKDNKVRVLVATNVAARGLDIHDVTHIINFDEPQTYDEYIHRIGRTGRNGKKGVAYTFVQTR